MDGPGSGWAGQVKSYGTSWKGRFEEANASLPRSPLTMVSEHALACPVGKPITKTN